MAIAADYVQIRGVVMAEVSWCMGVRFFRGNSRSSARVPYDPIKII